MPSANDMRKGMAIRYNNDPCMVMEREHRTPGNKRAFVQATLRNLRTGRSQVVKFSSTEPIEIVTTTSQHLEFSYQDQAGYHFMDPSTYETVDFSEEFIGDAKNYLVENLAVTILCVDNKPAEIELPLTVDLKVAEAPPGVRGDTATNVTKPATLETGVEVGVPLFINPGDTIRIDTRTGKYVGRA